MARNEVSALREKVAAYKASIIARKAFPVGTSQKIRSGFFISIGLFVYLLHFFSVPRNSYLQVLMRVDSFLFLLHLKLIKKVPLERVKQHLLYNGTFEYFGFLGSPTFYARVLVEPIDDIDADSLKGAAEHLIETLQDPAVIILGSCPGEGKVSLVAAFTPTVVDLGIQAGKFISPIAKLCGGGGGGRPNFAQAGGRKPENLPNALGKAKEDLVSLLSEKAS
ncbi:hypothetical protein SLE2022_144580 [Rubroshorea leprosula]